MKEEDNMTIKEKLSYFISHGITIKYVADKVGVDASTLSKWLKNQKGITHKNEEKVNEILVTLVKELTQIME